MARHRKRKGVSPQEKRRRAEQRGQAGGASTKASDRQVEVVDDFQRGDTVQVQSRLPEMRGLNGKIGVVVDPSADPITVGEGDTRSLVPCCDVKFGDQTQRVRNRHLQRRSSGESGSKKEPEEAESSEQVAEPG